MQTWLLVFLGGGLGSLSRFALSRAVSDRFLTSLPLGTLFVNLKKMMSFCVFISEKATATKANLCTNKS